ncbi:MAG: glutamine--fructose-6-phosphate transaminase (isomerizing) [Culicoidibacterales bacterium]
MCGIVGMIGKTGTKAMVLKGLETLEYRGYDSAGIALHTGEAVEIYREKGRIADLKKHVPASADAPLGIGHTRWATHGRPSKRNSHPHQSADGRITLVHNGVIENEKQLRHEYLSDLAFLSDTDTEVIVQLLGQLLAQGAKMPTAIIQLQKLLHGSYALAIIDKEQPDVLYAVKNKSPLLIGKGEAANYLGSDALAMIDKTKHFYELNDGEFAILTSESVEIYAKNGEKVTRETYEAEIDANDLEKGPFKHYMMKEMHEQPAVVRRIIAAYLDEKDQTKIAPEVLTALRGAKRLFILAAGTSYHAGLMGKQYLETMANIPTEVHLASEFVYNMPMIPEDSFFIFISQSGETADSRAALVAIRELGFEALTITNVPGSTLSREANYTLLLHAGPEIAVASTKAYTAQLTVLALVAAAINNYPLNLKFELSRVATAMEHVCEMHEQFEMIAQNYFLHGQHAFYIGRHVDYFVALEAALKLKEISYIHTEGFAAGELKHGTIALIEDGTPVIGLISQQAVANHTRSNLQEVAARGAHTATIVFESLAQAGDTVIIDDVHEMLAPLVMVLPVQFLSYYAAYIRDCDIDKPRNLAKSVTVE